MYKHTEVPSISDFANFIPNTSAATRWKHVSTCIKFIINHLSNGKSNKQ